MLVFPAAAPQHISAAAQRQLFAPPRGEYTPSLFLTEADFSHIHMHKADRARREVRQQNRIVHPINFQNNNNDKKKWLQIHSQIYEQYTTHLKQTHDERI